MFTVVIAFYFYYDDDTHLYAVKHKLHAYLFLLYYVESCYLSYKF